MNNGAKIVSVGLTGEFLRTGRSTAFFFETLFATVGMPEFMRGQFFEFPTGGNNCRHTIFAEEVDPLVHLEHTQDRLKQIAAAEWKSPESHPDLTPAHEVLLFREHFTEMLRMDVVAKESEGFREMLRDSEAAAGSYP